MQKNILKRIVKDIKSLKIQGATDVRKASLKALKFAIENSGAKSLSVLKKELNKNASLLASTRCTEPELRTALRIILASVHSAKGTVKEVKKELLETINNYEADRQTALKNIAKYGADKIPKGCTVLTHCHSHTVEAILEKAWKMRKLKRVICTETRPLFQGRITAKQLLKAKVPTTMIVDSAASAFMKEADVFISGADAILEDGSIVNKIGTKQISIAAEKFGVPHYAAASSHKFDPVTFFGKEEKIEQRPAQEIWKNPPQKLKIENPAFDVTDASYIKGIICEKGILAPHIFALRMYNELELGKRKKEYFELMRVIKWI